jgi:predicted Zn finger-like uncharacterized protein
MVVRCFQCNGLLRVDESSLPTNRRARVRCPHCKGIGLMPDRLVARSATGLSSAEPAAQEEADYPSLLPLEPPAGQPMDQIPDQPVQQQPAAAEDWKETALPRDAFKSFRYPGERDRPPGPKKAAAKGWPPIWLIVVSIAVVAFFALLVNIILPGPAGVNPAIHTVPPEQAGASGVSEENLSARRPPPSPAMPDRR